MRANEIERAGLRADDPRVTELTERERPEPVRVADGDEAVAGEHDEGERAADLRHRIHDRLLDAAGARLRVEVEHHLGVGARLEDGAVADELVPQLARVHQVAVVTNRDLSVDAVDQQRLGVRQLALTCRRVADVADGARARQLAEHGGVEHLRDVAHALADPELMTV